MHTYFCLLLLLTGFVQINCAEKSREIAAVYDAMGSMYEREHQALLEMVEQLKIQKFSKKTLGEALLSAAHFSNLSVAQEFIKAGADVNYTDQGNFTALIWAASHGKLDMIEMLLMAGATNIDHENVFNDNALFSAIKHGSLAVVRKLIKEGADVNYINSRFDKTPLCVAAEYGKASIARELIKAGADVNYVGCSHYGSPLKIALDNDNPKTAQVLKEAGAVEN